MLIPYGIGSYKRDDLPQVVLRNLFAEKTPVEPNKLTLLPRPALVESETIGTGPSRAVFQRNGLLSGATFIVSGSSIYNGSVQFGTLPGSGSVIMTAALNVLVITNGVTIFTSDGTAITAASFPDTNPVGDLAYLGGLTLAGCINTGHVYFTLDPTTWDALDYFGGAQAGDTFKAFAIVLGQLWVFFATHTEIFSLTGVTNSPFQAIEGRVFDKGTLSRDSVINCDNTVFWVGNDGIVYRGSDTPLRISDNGIEEMIADSDVSDILAWQFPWNGHLFYVLHTTSGTRAYDVSTQEWCELASYGRTRWRARQGQVIGRDVIVGDDNTGQIWKLTKDIYEDDGQPIQRIFTVLVQDSGFIDNLFLDCSVGEAADPNDTPGLLEMRTSRDGGDRWTNWRQCDLGKQGQYRKRAGFRRIGLVDQASMIIQLRITDPVPSSIRYVRVNEAQGGRSR